jgi:DNA-binding NarL/FixJ family response regulator
LKCVSGEPLQDPDSVAGVPAKILDIVVSVTGSTGQHQFHRSVGLFESVDQQLAIFLRGKPAEECSSLWVADGLSNRNVAAELGLSEHTVEKYLFRIFEKLGISNRVELVLYAMHNGADQPAEWIAGA